MAHKDSHGLFPAQSLAPRQPCDTRGPIRVHLVWIRAHQRWDVTAEGAGGSAQVAGRRWQGAGGLAEGVAEMAEPRNRKHLGHIGEPLAHPTRKLDLT